jgi:hypothetical protein
VVDIVVVDLHDDWRALTTFLVRSHIDGYVQLGLLPIHLLNEPLDVLFARLHQ